MIKTFLVARREYVDNLRTKTFWIGVLAFPVILTLCFLLPMLLEGTKDVRRYAVLDRSGWLLPEIRARLDNPDLYKVVKHFIEEMRGHPERLEALPEAIRRMVSQALETPVDDEQLRRAARRLEALRGPGGSSLIGEIPEALLRPLGLSRDDLASMISSGFESLRKWWNELPAAEHDSFAPDDSREDAYRLVDLAPGDESEARLNERLARGKLFAYLVIGEDPVASSEGCKYVSNNLTDEGLRRWFSTQATNIVRQRRIEKYGITDEVADLIQARIRFEERKVSREGEEEEVAKVDTARQWAPVAFVYLLWISVFTISQMLLTNTIEEKSSRIIEVLLSSVSSFQLMVGKILGIAATGLTVLFSWIFFFLLEIKLAPFFLESIPEIDVLSIAKDPLYLASFVGYFLLGYLFYASFLVGVGSVCNSVKEAQNLMIPIVLVLIVPLLSMVPIAQDPNGTLARFLSFIPPFTPFVMMNRAAGPPARWEYIVTTLLMVPAIALTMWAAARVFRTGVLMTGKPPRLREIFRWIREAERLV